jgi:hypothetical protein
MENDIWNPSLPKDKRNWQTENDVWNHSLAKRTGRTVSIKRGKI